MKYVIAFSSPVFVGDTRVENVGFFDSAISAARWHQALIASSSAPLPPANLILVNLVATLSLVPVEN